MLRPVDRQNDREYVRDYGSYEDQLRLQFSDAMDVINAYPRHTDKDGFGELLSVSDLGFQWCDPFMIDPEPASKRRLTDEEVRYPPDFDFGLQDDPVVAYRTSDHLIAVDPKRIVLGQQNVHYSTLVLAMAAVAFRKKVESVDMTKIGRYLLVPDGHHRLVAAYLMDAKLPVNIRA